MSFQITALPESQFAHLFQLSDQELSAQRAVRRIVTESPGTPCRVSLEDALAGEEVILVNHQHLPAESPYQASHAIYVRRNAKQASLEVGEIPAFMHHRLMSVRIFDGDHMMIEADAVEGLDLKETIEAAFQNPQAEFIHLHIAKPGCFAASVRRA